ncbi:MAG TPA: hypothetical protein VLQ20_08565, partial [Planococcus sp. (in: firmicutes)]|nr:hypothetical protein [Planococcus sp. (in: firmicutes)]
MLNKILSLFFKDDSEEDDKLDGGKSNIPVRNPAKEQKTASKIRNIGLLTAPLKDFRFAGFRSIRNLELQFTTDFGEPKSLLAISFLYQEEEREFDVLLNFIDLQSLNLSSPGRTFDISLAFMDLTEFGWEDMKFEVGDYEDGSLHFYCAAIEVASVSERPRNQTIYR